MISSCSSPSGANPIESIKFTTSRSALSTKARSLPTCAMPHVVAVRLGDRDVELVADATLDCEQHLSFALERMILRQEQGQPHDADDHDDTPPPPTRSPRARNDQRTRRLRLKLLFDRRLAAHGLGLGRGQLAQNRFHLESLDDVVGLHVVEVFERDTAFVALCDFAGVVLEALEGGELAFPYGAAVAHQ